MIGLLQISVQFRLDNQTPVQREGQMRLPIFQNFKEKLLLGFGVVCVILILKGILYLQHVSEEPFMNWQELIASLQAKNKAAIADKRPLWKQKIDPNQQKNDALDGYNKFIGFIYANPANSGLALDGLRDKFFSTVQPPCAWRVDWLTVMYPGTTVPAPAESKTAASEGLYKWIECALSGDVDCINKVYDIKNRFFTQDCPVVLPLDPLKVRTKYATTIFTTAK